MDKAYGTSGRPLIGVKLRSLWSFGKLTSWLLAWAVIFLAGRSCWISFVRPEREQPDQAAVLRQVRQVARLTLLEVNLYRKIVFQPDPPAPDGMLHALWLFAANHLRTQSGKVIVFAQGSVGIDVSQLAIDGLHLSEDGSAEVALPPLWYELRILPGETEVIASNLTSEQTAALLAEAEKVMLHQLQTDTHLQQKANQAAQQWFSSWLARMGYTQVRFVATSSSAPAPL